MNTHIYHNHNMEELITINDMVIILHITNMYNNDDIK